MKKLLIILFSLIGYITNAQIHYNPSLFTVSNKSYGSAQATPTEARSQFRDTTLPSPYMRNYVNRAEVLSYLYLAKYREGRFPIYMDSAGHTVILWFRDGTANSNLVVWNTDASSTDSAIFATNYRVDTAKLNLRAELANKISRTLPSGQILVGNISNVATPVTPSNDVSVTSGGSFTVNNQWKLAGNAGTTDLTNFVGTTDNVPLSFKVNGFLAGRIDHINANTFLGYRAGRATSGGANNSALGYGALLVNTSGGGNLALGSQSLFSNLFGNNNVSVGYNSLSNSISGNGNTVVGTNTGLGITTGQYNTILGGAVSGLSPGLNNNIIVSDGQGNKRFTIDSFGTSVLPSTTALGLPVGNTSERPTSPAAGYIRFNTDSTAKETFNGSIWVKDGSGGGGGGGTTNLDSSRNSTSFTITNDNGTAALILQADSGTKAGAYPPIDRKKVQRNEFSLSFEEMRLLTNPSGGVFYNTKVNNIFAQFYWNPTSTEADDSVMVIKLASVTTGRLKRYFEGPLWVEWFGAIGDDGIDDSYAFQKCINYAVHHSQNAAVNIGGGVFNVANVVISNYSGGNAQYVAITISGISSAYDAISVQARTTELRTTDPTAFTLALQRGAGCTIRNIAFKGAMAAASGINQIVTWTDAQWNAGGTVRDNGYSPHCAIPIDPFTTAVTGSDRYPGALSYYSNAGRTGTSGLTIDGCSFRNYICAIGIGLAPDITNDDNIVFQNGVQLDNKVFWGTGQRQSRGNAIVNLYSIGGTQGLIEGKTFGAQSGTPPVLMNSSIAAGIKYIYNVATDFGSMIIDNCYLETVWSLGTATAGGFPVVIKSSQIFPDNEGTFHAPVFAQGNVLQIKDTWFDYVDNQFANGYIFNVQQMSMDGCTVNGGVPVNFSANSTTVLPLNLNNIRYVNFEAAGVIANGQIDEDYGTLRGAFTNPKMVFREPSKGQTYTTTTPQVEFIPTETKAMVIDSTLFRSYFLSSDPTMYTVGEFLTTTTSINYTNDYISACKSSLGWVYSISADTIKLKYLPFGVRTDTTYPIFIARNPRFMGRILGSVATGSDTIRNVIFSNGSTGLPAVGSFIKGTGIPVATRIVYVSSDKIALSRVATATADTVEFYDAKVQFNGIRGISDVADDILFYAGDITRNYNTATFTTDYYRCTAAGLAASAHAGTFIPVGSGSGVQALAAVGGTPNANGGTVASQVLTLAPADVSNPGSMLATDQSFGGVKDFVGNLTIGTTMASSSGRALMSFWRETHGARGFVGLYGPDFGGDFANKMVFMGPAIADGIYHTDATSGDIFIGSANLYSQASTKITLAGTTTVQDRLTLNKIPSAATAFSMLVKTADSLVRQVPSSMFATQSALNDTAAAIRAAIGGGGGASDTLKVFYKGVGMHTIYPGTDTLYDKTIAGLNSVSVATGSDSTINIKLVNDTAIGTAAGYYYGTSTGGSAGRLGFYALPGITALATFGSTPANAGASISGNTLTLQPADATHGGGVSTTTQTFTGFKTFAGQVIINGGAGSGTGHLRLEGNLTGAPQSPGAAGLFINSYTYTDNNTATGNYNNDVPANVIIAPTYAATNSGVVYTSEAATFAITGAPIAGSNITLNNPLAFSVNSGKSFFGGSVNLTNLDNVPHAIFTPTTGGTVSLTNRKYNIINPSGSLLALTVNLPSSPADNDVVYIKYTQAVTTVTYGNGTVVDGIISPISGSLVVLVYDSVTTSWY